MTDHFEDMLNAFLDGTITDVDESILFSLLERESALREQFVIAVRAQQAAPYLGEATAPSTETTDRIMALAAQSHSRTAAGLSIGGPLIIAISAILVAGLVFLGGVEWERATSARQASGEQHTTGSTSAGIARYLNDPPARMPAAAQSDHDPLHGNLHRGRPLADADESAGFRSDRDQPSAQPAEAAIQSIEIAPTASITALALPHARASAPQPLPTLLTNDVRTRQAVPLRVHVRTLQSIGSPSSGVSTNDQTGLNNLAADALYPVADGLDVGIEIGRQSFLQEYQRTAGGVTEAVQQFPALFWAGPTMRYTFHDVIAERVSPYGQLVLGVGDGGAVGRVLAGVAWNPDERVSFTGGIEAGHLWYTADGSSQTSLQLNWSIGVGFAW